MKCVLLFVVVACSVYYNNALKVKLDITQKLRLASALMQCAEEHKLSYRKLMAKGFAHFRKTMEKPKRNRMCFIGCMINDIIGFENNMINKKVAGEMLSRAFGPKNAKEVMKECQNITDEDTCTAAYKSFLCFDKMLTPLVKSNHTRLE